MHHFVSILFLAASYRLCCAQSTNSSLSLSTDGSCGESSNQTCVGSTFGSCCSDKGFCGATNDFCNPTAGCQSSYGSCSTNTSFISYDGKCGSTDPNKQVCVGSTYGSCCSEKGWCGGTSDYCGVGCQSAFGTCGGANTTVETNPDATSSSATTAAATSSRSTSSGSSPSSSTNTADSANSASADAGKSGPSLVGYQAAIGVLCGLLVILSVIIAVLLLKRRMKQQPTQEVEKADTVSTDCSCGGRPFSEAGCTHQTSVKSTFATDSTYVVSPYESSKPLPAELGSTGHGRAELREDYVEVGDQKSQASH